MGCIKPTSCKWGVPLSTDDCSDAATYLCPKLLVKMLLFGHCRSFNYFLHASAVSSREAPLANGERASNLAGAALIALISALPRLTAPPGGPGAAAGTRSSSELQSPGGGLGVLGVFWGCWCWALTPSASHLPASSLKAAPAPSILPFQPCFVAWTWDQSDPKSNSPLTCLALSVSQWLQEGSFCLK